VASCVDGDGMRMLVFESGAEAMEFDLEGFGC